jgi:hypothetical protein
MGMVQGYFWKHDYAGSIGVLLVMTLSRNPSSNAACYPAQKDDDRAPGYAFFSNIQGSVTNTASGPFSRVDYNKRMRYVDLGLPSGTLWAEFNLGASSSGEVGDFYAWGELETKTEYSRATYKYWNGSFYTKYNSWVNGRTLLPEDDVVNTKYGGGWQIPSSDDLSELFNNCTIEADVYDSETDTHYTKVTSNINGNSIRFLPGGFKSGNTVPDFSTQYFYIWTSGPVIDSSTEPNWEDVPIFYGSWYYNTATEGSLNRFCGANIRPIFRPIIN